MTGLGRSILLSVVSLLLPLPFLLSSSSARVVPLQSNKTSVDYGTRSIGEVFSDTLSLITNNRDPLPVSELETTCDCVTGDVLDDGRIVFHFLVEEGESGPVTKVLYLFTSSMEMPLVRLQLHINVNGSAERQSGQSETIEQQWKDESINSEQADLDILYFYSPGCRTCRRVRDYVLPHIHRQWGTRIAIEKIDIDNADGFVRLLSVREQYGVADKHSPFLFVVGDSIIQGGDNLTARLDTRIAEALDGGETSFVAEAQAFDDPSLQARHLWQTLSFWTIVGAGLIDGVNPCAFATLVFFISFLAWSGSTRKQLLIVGGGFSASVFIVYFLLGLGAFRALQALSFYSLVSQWIWWLTLGLLGVLTVLSTIDLIRYLMTGKTSSAILQLSPANKRRVHRAVRRGLSTPSLLLGSLLTGATVTLFEAACTGQVYLPTIVLLSRDPVFAGRAVGMLLLYNLLFILPLLVVFILAWAGTASQRFAEWSRQHYGWTRGALSLLFLLMLFLMLLQEGALA
jgi:cytochrome c biogenesis protein CcdA